MSRDLQAKILAAFFALATVGLMVIVVWDLGYHGKGAATADASLLIR